MLLPFRENRLFRVKRWSGDSTAPDTGTSYEETDSLDEADIVTSVVREPSITLDDLLKKGYVSVSDQPMHMPVLDIDIPAALVDSTTPGRHHLYIDAQMSWETYVRLLDVMAEAGILEIGYVKASIERGFTAVRLPWVRKDQ